MSSTLTPTVSQIILTALTERIDSRSVFSAFDVTEDARKETKDNVYHNDVRDIVANEYAIAGEFPDDYCKEAIQLNIPSRGNPYAVVYFPDELSANDHPFATSNALQAPAPAAVSTPAPAATSSPKQGGAVKDGDAFICTETSKGVINIPKVLTDKITPNGGSFDLQVGGKLICKKPDGEGRLRICSSRLGGGSKFKLEVSTHNTITIESV